MIKQPWFQVQTPQIVLNKNASRAARTGLRLASIAQLWPIAQITMAVLALSLVGILLVWEIDHSYGISTYDDIFDHLKLYRTSGSLAQFIRYVFSLHNEHRIVTTRILMVLDERLDGGHETIPIVVSNVLQLVSALICTFVLCGGRTAGKTDPIQVLWIGAILILMFLNANLLETLDLPFQVQHAIMGVLAILSAWVLASANERSVEERSFSKLLAPMLCLAAVASLTLGNAPVLLMAAFVTAVVFRWGLRWIVIFGLLAVLHTVATLLTTPGVGDKTRDVFAILDFTTLYLGSPFVRIMAWPAPFVTWATPVIWAKVVGWIILAIPSIFGALQLVRPQHVRAPVVFGFALCIIVIVTALAAGYSRAQFGIEAASDKKYASFAALGWVGSFMIMVAMARQWFGNRSVWVSAMGTGAYLVLFPLCFAAQDRETRIWGYFMQKNWQAAMAAFVGVGDHNALQDIYSEPAALLEYIQALQLRGRSVFSRYAFRIGDPLATAIGSAQEVACRSEVESVDVVSAQDTVFPALHEGTAYKIRGWTWMTDFIQPSVAIIVVDTNGHIVGLAHSSGPSERAMLWLGQSMTQNLEWYGYAISGAARDMRFYALSADHHAYCTLGTLGDTR